MVKCPQRWRSVHSSFVFRPSSFSPQGFCTTEAKSIRSIPFASIDANSEHKNTYSLIRRGNHYRKVKGAVQNLRSAGVPPAWKREERGRPARHKETTMRAGRPRAELASRPSVGPARACDGGRGGQQSKIAGAEKLVDAGLHFGIDRQPQIVALAGARGCRRPDRSSAPTRTCPDSRGGFREALRAFAARGLPRSRESARRGCSAKRDSPAE